MQILDYLFFHFHVKKSVRRPLMQVNVNNSKTGKLNNASAQKNDDAKRLARNDIKRDQ